MIDVKEAVKIAFDYLGQLYDVTQLHDILLEEVALSDDEKYWYVTIGFSRSIPSTDPMRALSEALLKQAKYQREYKVFQIDSATGQVRSMKIRAA
ncbi:MAG TPA: hypothetical protein VNO70_10615 [Blastocatellia bacterium]|nr:hypothetical protein [Blastocatellia bacterium]